jgi:hypothetical protein
VHYLVEFQIQQAVFQQTAEHSAAAFLLGLSQSYHGFLAGTRPSLPSFWPGQAHDDALVLFPRVVSR